MKKYLLAAAFLLLSACSHGISGVYADAMGVSRYSFKSDGNVTITVMGASHETRYVRDGDTLKVAVPETGVSLDFTIENDGSLRGPLGMRLHKVDE